MKKQPFIIGLTGGIASGKSTVLKEFRRCGAVAIDVDNIARVVVRPGTKAAKNIVRVFGKTVLSRSGSIDRAKLASLIFSHPRLRRRLEKITHPAIVAHLCRQIRLHKKQAAVPMIVAEVPLLYEAGLQKLFDAVVVVWVSAVVQRQRLIAREGLLPAEATRRMKAQYPLSRKRAMADHVITNNGSRSAAARQVRSFFKRTLSSRLKK